MSIATQTTEGVCSVKLSESAQELLELLWIATQEEGRPGLDIGDMQSEGIDEPIGTTERCA
jgi:hypothetical protein